MAIMAGALVDAGDFADSGWLPITADTANGFSSALEGRRIGERIVLRGSLGPSTNWGTANSAQQPVATGGVPALLSPPVSLLVACTTTAGVATVVFRVAIQSNGGIQVRCDTASHTGSCAINLDYLAT